MIVRFVDVSGFVYHHCLELHVHFVDVGGLVDHHCLNCFRRDSSFC